MAAGLVVLGAAVAGHGYALRAAMPSRTVAVDAYAPLAVVAAVISVGNLGGSFSVGFMQVEQAASHAPMLAYATACMLFASWRSLRDHAGSAPLAAAAALLATSAAIAAAAIPGAPVMDTMPDHEVTEPARGCMMMGLELAPLPDAIDTVPPVLASAMVPADVSERGPAVMP